MRFSRFRPAFELAAALALAPGLLPIHAQQTPGSPAPVVGTAAAPPVQQQSEKDHRLANDYGQLGRYAAADAALPSPAPGEKRVIFFGDSITDGWHLDQYFPGKASYLNRGIGGQTTPQMLVRLRQDVLDLRPAAVLILAGTNDLAGNTGPETLTQIEEDYASIAELARLHGIRVIFASVTPVSNYVHPDMTRGRPPEKILALNTWLKSYCAANQLVYLDYFPAMVDATGALGKDLSADGLHPNAAGYTLMAPLAEAAIEKALAMPAPAASTVP